ncbi:16S rRNA (guanine(527)-N(7))-methyltransferase RsmG [soil metagenome]
MPDEAQGVFADRLDLAAQFAALLATDGVVRGLIGPREAPRLWQRHLLNCAVVEEVIAAGASVCDIGSGAGLPGVVLAIARPDVTVTLVEPLLRRTTFLDEVVATLGLDNVRVRRARAEALHGEARFDVVTSRAVAPLPRLLAWSLPLVSPRGEMIALKGSNVTAEVAEASELLRARGCAPARIVELGAGRIDEPTWAVRIAWRDPSSVSLSDARRPARAKSADARRRPRGPSHGR